MAQLSESFVFIIRYILNNPDQERFQIDKHLIGLGYNPEEMDRAWKAVEAGLGRSILQTNKLPGDEEPEVPKGCAFYFLGGLVVFTTFFGWGSIVTWFADRLDFPLFIVLPMFLAGVFISLIIYFIFIRLLKLENALPGGEYLPR